LHIAGADDLVASCRRSIRDLTVQQVAGNHASMLEPPHVTGLAAALREAVHAAFEEPMP
jgi:thioesterase domain-containing protein